MKKIFFLLSILSFMIGFTSCKKDQYYLYNTQERGFLQFGYTVKDDTLSNYSFFYNSAARMQDTVYFDLFTVGGPRSVDRVVKLIQKQVPNVDNAVPGVHYKAFDDPSLARMYTLKAGAATMKLPVVVLRDPSLKTKAVQLKFEVADNDNFKVGEASLIWRKLIFTDKISQPAAWDAYYNRYFLGTYSVTKHTFMIEQTGQKWDDDFLKKLRANIADLLYWGNILKTKLIEYNTAHPGNPLKDEFGNLVVFPVT